MQLVAREMNLSETAFLVKRGHGYDLRWFTPAVEVDLCGHATLASAHVLWEAGATRTRRARALPYQIGRADCQKRGDVDRNGFPCDAGRTRMPLVAKMWSQRSEPKPEALGGARFDYLVEAGK